MNAKDQIKRHIADQPEQKRGEMQALHRVVLRVLPGCKLWFSDGKNDEGKTIANPTIGYGSYLIRYANGTSREFFQIGMAANQTGISIHLMGIKDKTYLAKTFGKQLGKAKVTGYCIRFKTLADINVDVLEAAMRYGVAVQDGNAV